VGRVVGRKRLAKSTAGCVATAALVLAAGAPGAPGFGSDLMTMSPDGTDLRPLVAGPGMAWGAAWSPDGGRLAFVRDGDIYIVNADGTGVASITDGSAWDFAPAWSPDGTKIAFSRENGPNAPADVYVMNADGSAQANITNNVAFDSHPAWSPDGTRIAFVSNREGGGLSSLYVMSPDGSSQRPFGATPLRGFDPDWSPDGTRLAYSKDNGPPFNYTDIAVVDAGGSNEHVIASDPPPHRLASSPSWSPDGTKIVFGRGWRISVVNADGTGLHDLMPGLRYQAGPAWSPEGDEIVFEMDSPTADVPPPPPPPGMPPPPPRPPPPPPPAPPRARCVVPRVLGMMTRRARSRIRARHCSVGRIRRTHSRRVGRVVRQTPRPGALKRRGYPVKLVIGRR
jgi:Tol biopolymer transport system component